jgi:peptidyl-prolyl cis-trans isomerase D
MFDLFRSRAKIVRYMLGGLLVIVALSMVTYLIPGGGYVGGGQQGQVIAEIGKDALTVRDVQQQMQAAMRNRSIPQQMVGFYAGQVVDDMIGTRALVYEAKRRGIEVTDAELIRQLRMYLPQLFPGGQFVGKEAYAAILQQQGLTIPEFEAQLRQQMVLSRLTGLVSESVIVTPAEVAQEYRRRNEKVKLDYIAVSPEQFTSQVNITPEFVRSYYEKALPTGRFQVPEARSFDLLVADEVQFGQRIAIPDADLRRAYDSDKDQYRVPARVHVQHILLKTTDKPQADLPKIQARAEDLVKQLKAGADFNELAKKNSEDPGSATKGGDLGWIVRDQTVKAFESTAFSLKPKEISSVIKTEYGFHILQVLEKEEAHLRPFEEVKDQIADGIKKQQLFEMMQKVADQAHDEVAKHPQQAAEIAARLGLSIVHADKVGAGAPIPVLGVNPDFTEAVSGLKRGGVTPVLQARGNKLVMAVVTEVFPVRAAQFAEVEGQIRALLLGQRTTDMAGSKATAAFEQAKATGDLKKAAQQLGLEVKTTQEFGMDGAADGIGPANVLQPAFQQPVGSFFGPVVVGDKRFVCKIASRTQADMSNLDAATRADIQATVRSNKGRERMDLFVDSVRAALVREGKVKIYQDVLNRVIASYRS